MTNDGTILADFPALPPTRLVDFSSWAEAAYAIERIGSPFILFPDCRHAVLPMTEGRVSVVGASRGGRRAPRFWCRCRSSRTSRHFPGSRQLTSPGTSYPARHRSHSGPSKRYRSIFLSLHPSPRLFLLSSAARQSPRTQAQLPQRRREPPRQS